MPWRLLQNSGASGDFLVIVFPSTLAAFHLRLEAWCLDLDRVAVLDTPFIMKLIRYDPPSTLFDIWFSAWHMLHSRL